MLDGDKLSKVFCWTVIEFNVKERLDDTLSNAGRTDDVDWGKELCCGTDDTAAICAVPEVVTVVVYSPVVVLSAKPTSPEDSEGKTLLGVGMDDWKLIETLLAIDVDLRVAVDVTLGDTLVFSEAVVVIVGLLDIELPCMSTKVVDGDKLSEIFCWTVIELIVKEALESTLSKAEETDVVVWDKEPCCGTDDTACFVSEVVTIVLYSPAVMLSTKPTSPEDSEGKTLLGVGMDDWKLIETLSAIDVDLRVTVDVTLGETKRALEAGVVIVG